MLPIRCVHFLVYPVTVQCFLVLHLWCMHRASWVLLVLFLHCQLGAMIVVIALNASQTIWPEANGKFWRPFHDTCCVALNYCWTNFLFGYWATVTSKLTSPTEIWIHSRNRSCESTVDHLIKSFRFIGKLTRVLCSIYMLENFYWTACSACLWRGKFYFKMLIIILWEASWLSSK